MQVKGKCGTIPQSDPFNFRDLKNEISKLKGANSFLKESLKEEQEKNNKISRCLIDIEVELEAYFEKPKKDYVIRNKQTNLRNLLDRIKHIRSETF